MTGDRLLRKAAVVLDRDYGGSAWVRQREATDPICTLVRAILSQNTNDRNRDAAFDRLRDRFPEWEEVAAAPLGRLKDAIRPGGIAHQKACAIRAFLRSLQEERGAISLDFLQGLDDDAAVELLTRHKGIGIKTAYIVMGFSFGRDLCAVDTHVHRILRRLGLIDARCSRERAHRVLRPLVPRGHALALHVNLLDHGKQVCTARKPACASCRLCRLCPYAAGGRQAA